MARSNIQTTIQSDTVHVKREWGWFATLTAAGAFVVALIYGTASTLSAGDTWIALAAGRQIAEQGYANFPKLDTFSYSFTGHQWTNQNWLAHLVIWWLYDHVCPSATILYELVCVIGAGLFVVWAAHLNGAGAKLGAIGAAIAYVVGFNFFDIRPAAMSHLLAPGLHALLLASAYHSRRWLWGIPFILLIWGNAHGSFPFGFVLLGVWGFGLLVDSWLREKGDWRSALQTVGWLAAIALISAVLIALVSPFGLENLTHPFVVIGSSRFREIIEWAPAYQFAIPFPPVIPFFIMLGGFAVILGLFAFARARPIPKSRHENETPVKPIMTSEVLVALMGISLGLFSRRFIPTAAFLAMPLMMKLLALCVERFRLTSKTVNVIQGSFAGLIIVAVLGAGGWRIVKGYRPIEGLPLGEWLFLRRVNIPNEPADLVEFAKTNQVSGRVFAQWEWAAYCIFNWPGATVFIDGRSQALYSESMYIFYNVIEQSQPPAPADMVKQGQRLDGLLAHPDTPTKLGAELLLMKRLQRETAAIFGPLTATRQWVPLYANEIGMLLLRRENISNRLKPILEKFDRLALDWPDTMWGHFSKALAAQTILTPNFESAITSYKKAIAGGPRLAFYQGLAQCYVQVGRTSEAQQYLQSELQRLSVRVDKDVEDTQQCIQFIRQVLGMK